MLVVVGVLFFLATNVDTVKNEFMKCTYPTLMKIYFVNFWMEARKDMTWFQKLANKSEMILYNKTVHVRNVKFSARVGRNFPHTRPEYVSERIKKTLSLFKRHFEDVRQLIGSIRYGCGCRYNFMKDYMEMACYFQKYVAQQ